MRGFIFGVVLVYIGFQILALCIIAQQYLHFRRHPRDTPPDNPG